jgi:hypothetical protein
MCRKTSGAEADGEVVWSWRAHASAKFCGHDDLQGDGDNKRFTEESAYKP